MDITALQATGLLFAQGNTSSPGFMSIQVNFQHIVVYLKSYMK